MCFSSGLIKPSNVLKSFHRSNDKYITSLGRTIVNFARIIPEGLLVFFPSYTVLNQCKEHWEGSGVWNQINCIKVSSHSIQLKLKYSTIFQKIALI